MKFFGDIALSFLIKQHGESEIMFWRGGVPLLYLLFCGKRINTKVEKMGANTALESAAISLRFKTETAERLLIPALRSH